MKVARFAYLDTQVSVFIGRLLDHAQRHALLHASPAEMRLLLQQAQAWPEQPFSTLTPKALEQFLIHCLLQEARILLRGMDAYGQRFLRHWLRRFEIINLKFLLRAKFAHLARSHIAGSLLDLGDFGSLPLATLAATESVNEFLRHLQATRYADMARQAHKVFEEQGALFDVEATLDAHFFHQLVQRAQEIPSAQGQAILRLLRSYLDQFNLLALLRFRLNYHLSPAHSYFLLPPHGQLLDGPRLRRIAQGERLEQMLAQLPSSLQALLQGVTSIPEAENRMVHHVRIQAKRLLQRHHFEMGRAYAYLYLREQQMQFLHTVLKGHILGVEPDWIRACGEPPAPPNPQNQQVH